MLLLAYMCGRLANLGSCCTLQASSRGMYLDVLIRFKGLVHLLTTYGLLDIGSEIEHNGHPLFKEIPSGAGNGFKVVPCNITRLL